MVHINKIYTRTGDNGTTGLGDGSRVAKTHARIRACGTVDELNCALGLARCCELPDDWESQLAHIQNSLFDLGADLCIPIEAKMKDYKPLRIKSDEVQKLEGWIDAFNENLRPLDSFILPGGNELAARLHLSRAVCRRAELDVLVLASEAILNSVVSMYLNRLSDYLFVVARVANNNGLDDVKWQPTQ